MSLLIEEPYVAVYPTLAKLIGLNEAILLQHIYFKLRISTVEAMGTRWVSSTIQQLAADLPFFSESTIKRTLQSLQEKRLVSCVKLKSSMYDHTNNYTIVGQTLIELQAQIEPTDRFNLTSSDRVNLTSSSSVKKEEEYSASLEEVVQVYHDKLPMLASVRFFNAKRRKALQTRQKAYPKARELDWWELFFEKVGQSPFLTGQNGKGWRADFDWLTTRGFEPIIEGKYEHN